MGRNVSDQKLTTLTSPLQKVTTLV